jgi:hypothetical protein
MKIIISSICIILGLIGVFQAADNLTSTTNIEPNKSFVLGEGKHGGYNAKLVNKGNAEIEIFTENENEPRKSVSILKANDKTRFYISKNTKVIFKNLGSETAVIGIVLSGDTGLSMGYQDNQK